MTSCGRTSCTAESNAPAVDASHNARLEFFRLVLEHERQQICWRETKFHLDRMVEINERQHFQAGLSRFGSKTVVCGFDVSE